MSYQEIIKLVSKDLNLPEQLVKKTYESYWRFVRDKISQLPLKEGLTELEFKLLSTNFNIPSLGKLNCTYDRYVRMNKRLDYIKKIKENKYDLSKED